jgi:FMN phosphatase YigB (HAD superfamily)
MDRNYCAPSGKNAALFVDVDGTLLVCQPYFDEAAENFAHYMALRGFDPAEAREAFSHFNHNTALLEGFEREVFPKALIECYRHLVKTKRRRFSAQQRKLDERIIQNIGNGPFFRPPQMFPNAAAVLGRAHHNFLIIAVSIGNREAQKYKVRQAGLDSVFDDMVVTARDDKQELVAQVIEDWNIDPHASAFIGNSQRSDGACLAVTNFIWLPLEGGWSFDKSKELPQETGFQLMLAKDWRECEEKGINRLVRRRKSGRASVSAADPGDCCKHRS